MKMISISQSSASFVNVAKKALVQNTVNEVSQAKEAGQPIDKEKIQASNQAVKDDLRSSAVAVAEYKNQIQLVDSYIQTSKQANEYYNNAASSSTETNNNSNNQINSFDAQAVNDARKTVQRRAVGVEIYERVQEQKVSDNKPQINPLEIIV